MTCERRSSSGFFEVPAGERTLPAAGVGRRGEPGGEHTRHGRQSVPADRAPE
ncbi:MAG TPA: hypothetical protein VGR37_18685 [Longimicrobiaceae bacterium]|nr:hypothetical protein [Longimicrobiaceae bacterium]